jgi:hypothetical protein
MRSMETGKEKRRATRVKLRSPLRYRVIPVDDAGFRSAAVQDVSLTGLRFRSQDFIARRASLILEIYPPGHPPVRSLARAVWVREHPSEGGYEVGGMFVEPPRGARTTLRQLVSG